MSHVANEEVKDKDASSLGSQMSSRLKISGKKHQQMQPFPSPLPKQEANAASSNSQEGKKDAGKIPFGVSKFRMPDDLGTTSKIPKVKPQNMPFLNTSLGNTTQSSIPVTDTSFYSQNPQSANKGDHHMQS